MVSFIPVIVSTSGRLQNEFIRPLFLQVHRETDHFFVDSGVHLAQHNSGLFHFRHVSYSAQAKCGNLLVKTTDLRIYLNVDEEGGDGEGTGSEVTSLLSYTLRYVCLVELDNVCQVGL